MAHIEIMTLLQKNIGIFAPSSSIIPQKFEAGLKILHDHGYKTLVHPQTYLGAGDETQLAGTTADKLKAYIDLCNDPSIDFLMAAAGGNRTCFLLEEIAKLKKHKPIMGYSDITALLGLHHKLGIPSLFGPTVQTFARMDTHYIEQTFDMLNATAGKQTKINLSGAETLSEDTISAPIFAATLSVLNCLIGTPYMPDLSGYILVIEDIGEEASSIDRMLWQLLSVTKPAALIFGQFVDGEETGRPYGQTLKEILSMHAERTKIPTLYNTPIDHYGRIFPIQCGKTATLDATNRILIL